MDDKTVFWKEGDLPPKLFILYQGTVREVDLIGLQTLGRRGAGSRPDIALDAPALAPLHGQFVTASAQCRYTDLDRDNATLLNGVPLTLQVPQVLRHGDVLRIQDRADGSRDVVLVYATDYPGGLRWETQSLTDDIVEIAVGREEDLSLQDDSVSRHHASFFHASGGWTIIDHGSLNGVYRNNRRLSHPVYLNPMDVVRIAGYLFFYTGSALIFQTDSRPAPVPPPAASAPVPMAAPSPVPTGSLFTRPGDLPGGDTGRSSTPAKPPVEPSKPDGAKTPPAKPADKLWERAPSFADSGDGGAKPGFTPGPDLGSDHGADHGATPPVTAAPPSRPSALHISIIERNVWRRTKKKTILKDIQLDIANGEMVLILGGSGAGKTTFLNAVMGYEKAEGQIQYDGMDIYREYERMKYEIGYVPQQDLLRMNDNVYDTLLNAAQMRLPTNYTQAEYEQRVEQTLNVLGLTRERDSLVSKLSGGQRKRLNIATQYIGNPSLFFLDEPDSGLDGTMARALMENLRVIADENKIVLVISHSPDRAADLFDKIIVLAKGNDDCGHLVFYGSPAESKRFFGVETLERIVGRINRPDEGGEGMADHYISLFERSGKK